MSGRRAFDRSRANVKQIFHYQKPRYSDLLLRGAGFARKYKLGQPAIQREVLLKRAQGMKFERSTRYKRMMEIRHRHGTAVKQKRVSDSHFIRQILLSQGPLTAERVYATALACAPELKSQWQSEKAHTAFLLLERLRIERYVFRMTMKRWQKLCAWSGHADGSQLGFDRRPLAASDHVYIPREVYWNIERGARYRSKHLKGSDKQGAHYQASLIPSFHPKKRIRSDLPDMAAMPSAEIASAARKQFLENMRARYARLRIHGGMARGQLAKKLETSMASDRVAAARQQAIEQLHQYARDYLKEPYA